MNQINIPKIIHYIWIGANPKPSLVIKCIESWKRYLPDYKIIEWNESNYNIGKHPYMISAYKSSKWAFVSDYIRFDVLYQYGGIYLDTDVEFLSPLPEDMLAQECFSCCEPNGVISPGLIMGCRPGCSMVKEILTSWPLKFEPENLVTVNEIVTLYLQKHGYQIVDKKQTINNFTIYPSDYFCSYDVEIGEPQISEKSISIHHYASTWRKKGVKNKIQVIVKNILGIKWYRKILKIKRHFFGIAGHKI